MSTHFDYFVIGAGSGGVRSSRIAASLGAKVGIAEGRHFGGTCVNIGCVPKKLMAYAADFHADFEDSRGYGWAYDTARFDWKTFIFNKNNEINRLNDIYKNLLEKHGVHIFNGYASFVDENTVQIGGERVTADKFLIAVGGVPRRASFPGAEHAIVSDDAFFLPEQPGHVVIVGGGYVAAEFAHIFSGMGSKVSLVHRGDRLLREFDTDMAQALWEEMEKHGITIHFKNEIQAIEKKEKNLLITLSGGDVITGDQVLLAIGRDANTATLGLDKAGVQTAASGAVQVDDQYRTSNPAIYALGDVTGGLELTPVAIAEGQALAETLFGPAGEKRVSYRNIPTAIFSRPPIATAGLSEEQARDEGHDIAVFRSRFRPMKNTLSGRDERSFMKLVVDRKTDKVLGVHMIGQDAPEILQGFAVALNAGATKADFDRTIGIHPTAAEEFVTMKQPD